MWVVAQNSSGFRLCRLLGIAAGGGGGAIARRGLLLLLPLLLLLALLALPLLLLPPLPLLLLACPLPLLLPLPMPMPPLPVVAATALAIFFSSLPLLACDGSAAMLLPVLAATDFASLLLLACDGIASSFDADGDSAIGWFEYALPLWLPADPEPLELMPAAEMLALMPMGEDARSSVCTRHDRHDRGGALASLGSSTNSNGSIAGDGTEAGIGDGSIGSFLLLGGAGLFALAIVVVAAEEEWNLASLKLSVDAVVGVDEVDVPSSETTQNSRGRTRWRLGRWSAIFRRLLWAARLAPVRQPRRPSCGRIA